MIKTKRNTFLLLGFLVVGLIACGGDQSGESQGPEGSTAARTEQPKPAELSPVELGQKIGDIYLKAMTELVALLKDRPEAAAVKPNMEVLKEAYVQELVVLGRQREALDTAGRAAVDSQLRMKARGLYNDPVFTSFNEIQQHYFQERDFHKIIMDFNIITQYAVFELLKKQVPEEASRLGIQ